MEKLHWFMDPVKNQYLDFTGRTSRENFWMYVLWYVILYIVVVVLGEILDTDLIVGLFTLAVLLPSIAITTRRLHDVGKSGWWQLIGLIPLIGLIVMIVFTVQEGVKGPNEYGEDPLASAGTTASAVPTPAPVPTAPVAENETESSNSNIPTN